MVVSCLSEVELYLELGSLCNDFIRENLDLAWYKLSIVPSVLIELSGVVEHLMDDTPFRQLLDIHIEYVFSCHAVDSTDFVLDDFYIVEGSSDQVCGQVHRCCDQNLLLGVLHEHVGHDSCEYFGLACAWRSLDQGNTLSASILNGSLLALIVLPHSIRVELQGEVVGTK